eukprot:TRINITY_DN4248_c3_g1_i1.p1 TRINITY_DN4248_c3_g1~~TRINITY_DN4248_c3_g1_i1.p1  ORF type:complete len:326 (+),score=46.64 TRINITY_DN4248_c3_g1_i1:59-1036(+)
MRNILLHLLVVAALFGMVTSFSCPMTCFTAGDSDCGFGELESCSETADGRVQLKCKNPCSQISLEVGGCTREFTCGWWERMWDCLVNVLPLLLRAITRLSTTVQYVVSGLMLLIGFWLCYRGVKDRDATAFFTGFFAGNLLGFAVGESYGFDSSDTIFYLIIFCLSGGVLLALLFSMHNNVVGYFFTGGCIPAVVLWFLLHIFIKDSSTLLIALACGCPLMFVVAGCLFLKYRRNLGMGIFSSLLGAAMLVQGGLYLAFQDNLRNCWTDTTASMVFAAALLPLAFLGGLLSQRSLMKSESHRSGSKYSKHQPINEETAYLNQILY